MFTFFNKGSGIQEDQGLSVSIGSGRNDLKEKKPIALSVVLAGVLLAIILLSYGGVFAYSEILDTQVAKRQDLLTSQTESFHLDTIESVVNFSKKVENANRVFRQRVSIPSILSQFEGALVQGNTLKSLNIVREGSEFSLTAEAVADTLEVYVQQASYFRTHPVLSAGFRTLPELSAEGVKYSYNLKSDFTNIEGPFDFVLKDFAQEREQVEVEAEILGEDIEVLTEQQ